MDRMTGKAVRLYFFFFFVFLFSCLSWKRRLKLFALFTLGLAATFLSSRTTRQGFSGFLSNQDTLIPISILVNLSSLLRSEIQDRTWARQGGSGSMLMRWWSSSLRGSLMQDRLLWLRPLMSLDLELMSIDRCSRVATLTLQPCFAAASFEFEALWASPCGMQPMCCLVVVDCQLLQSELPEGKMSPPCSMLVAMASLGGCYSQAWTIFHGEVSAAAAGAAKANPFFKLVSSLLTYDQQQLLRHCVHCICDFTWFNYQIDQVGRRIYIFDKPLSRHPCRQWVTEIWEWIEADRIDNAAAAAAEELHMQVKRLDRTEMRGKKGERKREEWSVMTCRLFNE